MMFRPRAGVGSSWWPLALVGFLLILLPILAVLQYRWIGEVSAAERQRLEGSIRVASGQLADDFAIEISRLSGAFELRDGFPRDGLPMLERYQLWAETAPYPAHRSEPYTSYEHTPTSHPNCTVSTRSREKCMQYHCLKS